MKKKPAQKPSVVEQKLDVAAAHVCYNEIMAEKRHREIMKWMGVSVGLIAATYFGVFLIVRRLPS